MPNHVQETSHEISQDWQFPVIVSFAAGAAEYHVEADRLARTCEALGLEYDIEHIDLPPDTDWSQICRFKTEFYTRKLREHKRAVLWVDADTQFVGVPTPLKGFNADFAAVPKRTRIGKFDAYSTTRMWRPAMLGFGYTPVALRFLEHMERLNAAAPANVTDDYLLQEAWDSFDEELSVLVLPLSSVAKDVNDVTDQTWTIDGHSGNVVHYVDKVVQHGTILNRGKILTEVAKDYLAKRELRSAEAMLLAAKDYGWDEYDRSRTYVQTLTRQRRRNEADQEIERYSSEHPEDGQGLLAAARLAMRQGQLETSLQLATRVVDQAGLQSAEAQSLTADITLEQRAAGLGLRKRDRPLMWWMKQPYPGNLGDILNPYIVEKLTGVPPAFGARHASMLAIGSVIKFAGDGQYVWGSGTPRMEDSFNPNAVYRAVRGPLTRKALIEAGAKVPEVYGDPALLLPSLYQPKSVVKTHDLGLIRHITHRGIGQLAEGVRDLDLRAVTYGEIEAFVDALVSCRAVLSSSLHGVIIAQAYGIPARLVTYSNSAKRIRGDGTKFADYFMSTGQKVQEPVDLAAFPVIETSLTRLIDEDHVSLEFDADALTEAFPWELTGRNR